MSERFLELKRRLLLIRLIAASAVGLALGLAVGGAAVLLSRLELTGFAPIWALPIGIVAFVLGGAPIWFFKKKSDGDVAAELDRRFGLGERTQTMLQYKDERGAIIALQKEDTQRALNELPEGSVRLRGLPFYIIAVALGAAMLVFSLVYRIPEEPPVELPPEPFSITEIQIAATEELIAYVSSSSMASPHRENAAEAITDMLTLLMAATTVPERDEALGLAFGKLAEITDLSSSAIEILEPIWDGGDALSEKLATALSFYSWTVGSEWDDFSAGMASVRAGLIPLEAVSDSPDPEKLKSDTLSLVSGFWNDVATSLGRSEVAPEDPLMAALLRFGLAEDELAEGGRLYGIGALVAAAENMDYAEIQSTLDASFYKLNLELFRAAEEQYESVSVGEYAITRISEIFDFPHPTLARPSFNKKGSNTGADIGGDESGGGGGGIGEGTVYGSDDLVLDPNTGELVEYGTILQRYYDLMFGKVSEGGYTDEQKAALEKYFEILYGGFGEEE